jgi:glutathione S-transferase
MAQEEQEKKKVQLLSLWASPFSQRVELALALKGIEYEKLEQNLADKSPLLIASNPVYKKIPVLLHGDHAVCESSIILQYIDEAFPGTTHLLPADAFGRTTARFWADFVDKKVSDIETILLSFDRNGWGI